MTYTRSAQYYDYFDSKGNVDFYRELAAGTEGPILELGVGTGRVLFAICRDGRDGVGIDNSPEMLREAKKKRRGECPDIAGRCRLLLADMLALDLRETFGFVFSPSGGVQGDSPEHLRGIFRSAADHLEQGGIFAFDVMSPSSLMSTRTYGPERVELPGGGVVIRFCAQTYLEGEDAASMDLLFKEHLPGQTRIVTVKEETEVAIITPDAITEALEYAGLRLRNMYGDFEMSPYTEESSWIVVVAEK